MRFVTILCPRPHPHILPHFLPHRQPHRLPSPCCVHPGTHFSAERTAVSAQKRRMESSGKIPPKVCTPGKCIAGRELLSSKKKTGCAAVRDSIDFKTSRQPAEHSALPPRYSRHRIRILAFFRERRFPQGAPAPYGNTNRAEAATPPSTLSRAAVRRPAKDTVQRPYGDPAIKNKRPGPSRRIRALLPPLRRRFCCRSI